MDMDAGWTVYESPLGALTVIAGPAGLREIRFPGRGPLLDEVARIAMPDVAGQLDRYFAGELRAFDLELDLRGGPLQRAVWALLREIPYGETTSYGELAGRVEPGAYPEDIEPYMRARLVGASVGRTPTPIVVPCHRVIGADGSLTGYGGGLHRKRALLDLELGAAQQALL
jgi:methylated-DNA-[protein]-cysteine S-methyltransferase